MTGGKRLRGDLSSQPPGVERLLTSCRPPLCPLTRPPGNFSAASFPDLRARAPAAIRTDWHMPVIGTLKVPLNLSCQNRPIYAAAPLRIGAMSCPQAPARAAALHGTGPITGGQNHSGGSEHPFGNVSVRTKRRDAASVTDSRFAHHTDRVASIGMSRAPACPTPPYDGLALIGDLICRPTSSRSTR